MLVTGLSVKGVEKWKKNDNPCLNYNGNGGQAGPYYEYAFANATNAECLQTFAFNTYVKTL